MNIPNKELRLELKKAGLPLWRLGELWGGVCEMTISRRLRHELPEETKKEVLALIRTYAEEQHTCDSAEEGSGCDEAREQTRAQRDLLAGVDA